MKFHCELVFSKSCKLGARPPKPSKPAMGMVTIQQSKSINGPKYKAIFSVRSDTSGQKFSLQPPPRVISRFINEGKMTIHFPTAPQETIVMINKASPTNLRALLEVFNDIAEGKEVRLSNQKVKGSDFKPKVILIRAQYLYERGADDFSQVLETLIVNPINLLHIDQRWFKCWNLHTLTLTGNPIGRTAQPHKFKMFRLLTNLQFLDISMCAIGELETDIKNVFFKTLPNSLVNLNLNSNALKTFPPIFHLPLLQQLSLVENELSFLPSRIAMLSRLRWLDIQNNQLTMFPFSFAPRRLERLHTANNPFISNRLLNFPVRHVSVPHMLGMSFKKNNVDTLKTIAANVIHRNPHYINEAKAHLPLSLKYECLDYAWPETSDTSVDLCCQCRKLRHIRSAKIWYVAPGSLAQEVDAFMVTICVCESICADCLRSGTNPQLQIHYGYYGIPQV